MAILSTSLLPLGSLVLAARGRGLANLIDGLSKGDPVAIGITVVLVLIFVAVFYFKSRSSGESSE